jgi:hypothetical protein
MNTAAPVAPPRESIPASQAPFVQLTQSAPEKASLAQTASAAAGTASALNTRAANQDIRRALETEIARVQTQTVGAPAAQPAGELATLVVETSMPAGTATPKVEEQLVPPESNAAPQAGEQPLPSIEPAAPQAETESNPPEATAVPAGGMNGCSTSAGGREKVRVVNNTGAAAALYLSGPEDYACTIETGVQRIYVKAGVYHLSGAMCSGQRFDFGTHVINPTWFITLKCP